MKTLYKLSAICAFVLSTSTLLPGTTINIPTDYNSIQEGIDHATNGDTVLVAPGRYVENLNFKGKNIVLASYFLKNKDEAFIKQTTIDGNFLAPVITLENGETQSARIIGFTIEGGANIFDNTEYPYAGGIVCVGASPVIWKNRIRNCQNTYFGYLEMGGIYCRNSNAMITENSIDSIQGAFLQQLGGIVSNQSNLQVNKNRISKVGGGYIFNGAGILADSSSMLNITFNVIDSCIFDDIPSTSAIKILHSQAEIVNNTLVGELALEYENQVTIKNNIILPPYNFGNPSEHGIVELNPGSSVIDATYNDVKGGWTGVGNIDMDPLFIDWAGQDFHLKPNSPCIDAGDPGSWPDPDATRADIGALYFQQNVNATPSPTLFTGIQIYPNPVVDLLHIDIAEEQPDSSITYRILTINGKIISEGWLKTRTNINLKSYPTGTYLLELKSDQTGSIYTQQIIKIQE